MSQSGDHTYHKGRRKLILVVALPRGLFLHLGRDVAGVQGLRQGWVCRATGCYRQGREADEWGRKGGGRKKKRIE